MKHELKNKNVLVVGLGKSGTAACRFLISKKARVTVVDERPAAELKKSLKGLSSINVIGGKKKFETQPYDLIVTSPGIPYDHPSLVEARKKNIPVWPELELGWRFVNPRKTAAITGTNGKTTTTALIGHILEKAKRPVVVGGNIGTPLSELTNRITPQTFLVLEVSSYQLEAHHTFHPDVAAILNVTPDHLARHKTIKRYAAAKGRLLLSMNKQDTVVYNQTDKWCRAIVKKSPAKKIPFPSSSLRKLGAVTILPGEHNIENAMAAAGVCSALGLSSKEIQQGIRTFKGVEHRIQIVAQKKGVLYVNDSKATNVDSTFVALKSFKQSVILLLGGEHKGSSYKPLLPLIKSGVKEIVAYGESKNIIAKDLKGSVPLKVVSNLVQAVKSASASAKKGDVVLLSPACASFDQYNNYEERGAHFISLVGRLKG